jgi:hypothetical protein
MMLPEIARASRSKRRRKSGTGGEVLGENLHSYGTTEMAVAGTVDKDHHNHLRDCLKYLVLSLPAQTPLEVRLAAMIKWHPESLTGEPRKAEDGPTWSASAN